jgi:hypothetical protein
MGRFGLLFAWFWPTIVGGEASALLCIRIQPKSELTYHMGVYHGYDLKFEKGGQTCKYLSVLT